MQAVWKYSTPVLDEFFIWMPKGAKPLHVHEQNDALCIWALVDPNEKATERRTFRVYGTGQMIKESLPYLGTFHMHDGRLVFHVFEVTE